MSITSNGGVLAAPGHTSGSGITLPTGNSVWGSVIPLSMGFRRIDGVPIWAGPLKSVNQQTFWEGGIYAASSFSIVQSFAVSFGERLNPSDPPPRIRRIWVGGQLVFSLGQTAGPPVTFSGGNVGYTPSGSDAPGAPVTNFPNTLVPTNLTFRFHDGNEAQLPDQALVAALGDQATAFRGLMYLVVEGLVVARGNTYVADTSQTNTSTLDAHLPSVSVELVDGSSVTNALHDFTMLPDAQSFSQPVGPMSNFNTREIAIVAAAVPPLFSKLCFYDMDTATQTSEVSITGPNNQPSLGIGSSNFAVWDKVNDVFYTTSSANVCMTSIARSGAIISNALTTGFANLTPESATGANPPLITDADPAVGFPRPVYGDIDYVLQAGALYPVVLAANIWVGAFAPSASGIIPPTLPPESFYQASGNVLSVKSLGLGLEAAVQKRQDYQDACFVVSTKDGVELVYVTMRGNVAQILGRRSIYTHAYASSNIVAMLDNLGNVVVQEAVGGQPVLVTKIQILTDGPADFTVAPTWRGSVFPKAGIVLLSASFSSMTTWAGTSMQQSDVSGNTFGAAAEIFDMSDFTLTSPSSFFTVLDGWIWDSVNRVKYYHGFISPGTQTFTGNGMKYMQVSLGIDGGLGTLGNDLRVIAEAAGYSAGDLNIGTELADEVPGVVIDHTYDLTTLFNDIGAVYDFTYFNSGGKLKFSRVSNNPVPAIGGFNITGTGNPTVTIQDGDTATIGTVVYRFKHTPSAPFDVKLCLDTSTLQLDAKQKTIANFLAAIMADLTLAAADSLTDAFFAGTVKHPKVSAAATQSTVGAYGYTSIALTAIVGGVAGNSIATTTTSSHATFDHPTLLTGAEPPAPSVTITRDDLAQVQEQQITQQDALITSISPPGFSQQTAVVGYYALEQDYTYSLQTFIPDNQGGAIDVVGASTIAYNLPFVMSTSEAYARIAKNSIRGSDNVVSQTFRLTQKFLLAEPSDVIAIQIPPFNYIVRLDECTFNGDWSTSYRAINYSFRSDVSIADSDSQSAIPQTVVGSNDGVPVAIDAPLLNPKFGTLAGNVDVFDGVRAYLATFGSAVLSFGKVGATPTPLATTSHDVKWGSIVGALPVAVECFYRTVEDSITLALKTIDAARDLASASYEDFVAGKNCLCVGAPGHWEYIFFRDVTLVGAKVVKLTGLIRGQRGTDQAATLHQVTDVALLVASVAPNFDTQSLVPQSLISSEVGSVYRYSSVGSPSSRAPTTVDVTIEGNVLKPFSPCRLKAHLAGGNDLNLSWTRRDRLGAEFVTNPQVLSEATELYDLEILSGSTVVRTVNGLTTPAYTYTSANQTTDGFSPPLTSLTFRVYQRGELGRGFPRTEAVNVQ